MLPIIPIQTEKFSEFPSLPLLTTNSTWVGLYNGANYKFTVSGGIADNYGAQIIGWSSQSTSMNYSTNYVEMIGALTGTPAIIKSVGTDENVSLSIQTQGTGIVNISPNGGSGYFTVNNSQQISSISNDSTLSANSPNIIPTQYAVKNYISGGTVSIAHNLYGGLSNQIPYQTAASTTSFMASSNNSVLLTNGSGVPSLGQILPIQVGTFVNVMAYGATGNGSTDDTTSIQNAINSLSSGGTVYFPQGTYKISTTLTLSHPIYLKGSGISSTFIKGTNGLNLITINSSYCGIFDLWLSPLSGTSLGYGITTNSSTSWASLNFERLEIVNLAIGININASAGLGIVQCYFTTLSTAAISISNVLNPDTGDWYITNCLFSSSSTSGDAILINSSGGGKIIGNKILSYNNGIHLAPSASISTGDLMVVGNSIENQANAGIYLDNTNSATLWGNSNLCSNQISNNPYGILVNGNCFKYIALTDNTFYGITTNAINVSSANTISIIGNSGVGSGTNFISLTSVINCTEFGNVQTGFSNYLSRSSTTLNNIMLPGINDLNNNVVCGLGSQSSAVNYINLVNSPTTSPLLFQAIGTDTNISFDYQAKGTGNHVFSGGNTIQIWSNNTYLLNHSISALSASRNVAWPDISGTVAYTSSTVTASTNISGGSANQIPYQTATSTTSFLSTANNSVLVTSVAGVPSVSSTLPSGLTIPSPKMTQILTPSGNTSCVFYDGGSPNYLIFANESGNPVLTCGGSTNLGISISPANAGIVYITTGNTSGTRHFAIADGTNGAQANIDTSLLSPSTSTTYQLPAAFGVFILSSASGTGIVSSPVSSNTATVAFGSSLTAGTSKQNTLGYDINLNICVVVTAATTATLTLGVGSTSTPTTNTVIPSFSGSGTYTFSAIVPSNYYVLVNDTGTITLSSITCQACPL